MTPDVRACICCGAKLVWKFNRIDTPMGTVVAPPEGLLVHPKSGCSADGYVIGALGWTAAGV